VSTAVVEPYNSILTTHTTLEHSDCAFMYVCGAGTAYPPVFSGIRVTRSLVLYVCFVDRCLSFCTFSFGHYVVCSSSIYGF
jgi:hypothetical protein